MIAVEPNREGEQKSTASKCLTGGLEKNWRAHVFRNFFYGTSIIGDRGQKQEAARINELKGDPIVFMDATNSGLGKWGEIKSLEADFSGPAAPRKICAGEIEGWGLCWRFKLLVCDY